MAATLNNHVRLLGTRLVAGLPGATVTASGSQPGHEFRGNQWTKHSGIIKLVAKGHRKHYAQFISKVWSDESGYMKSPSREASDAKETLIHDIKSHAEKEGWVWGVKGESDLTRKRFGKVVYFDSPEGQMSFHLDSYSCKTHGKDWPEYKGEWNGEIGETAHVLRRLYGGISTESDADRRGKEELNKDNYEHQFATDHSTLLSAVRAERLARRVEAVLAASSAFAAGHKFWGNQWSDHAKDLLNDPVGEPSGKIKHAVLVIGGKRFKGATHHDSWSKYSKTVKSRPGYKNVVDEEGFETESGHFLDRHQSESYTGISVKQKEIGLVTEDIENSRKLKKAANDFFALEKRNRELSQVPEVGDPEWGKATQTDRDKWRSKAERYAQEWQLDIRQAFSGNGVLENITDRDLANLISYHAEQYEEAQLYQLAKELGFGTDAKAALQAMEDSKLTSTDRETRDAVQAAADSKTVVKVILQDEAGRVLVLTDSSSGYDDLPGGHVQRGEDPVAGLVREVYEETGIQLVASDVQLYREQLIPKPHGGRMLLYKAKVDAQKVKISEEHSGAAWVKRDQLGQRNLGRYAKDVEEASKADSKASHSAARAKAQSEHKRAATQALALAAHAVADGQTAHPDGKAKIVGGMLAFMALGAAAAYLVAHRELADGEGVSQELELPQADGHAGSRTDLLKPAAEDAVAELEAEKAEVEKGQVARGTVFEGEVSKRLAKKAKELEGARWERIADTEATATYGAAALRVLDLAGFATVRWSQLDRPTKRHTHKLNQDQGEQPLGFVFQNGQSHPGDPSRGPEENINCLCQLVGVRRKEAK